MSYFKSKYRIVEVQANDGVTYYVPQRRTFLSYKSILPPNDPGYTRYSGAQQAVNAHKEISRTYHYIDETAD